MPNSTHSRGFRRLFDAVVSNVTQPLEIRLREAWRAGEDEPDASRQLATDIMLVATALHVKKGGLSWEQYAFLGDMYDYAFMQDYLGTSVDEHITRFFNLAAENEQYREPPTLSLNLLRGYDAIEKTQTARMYKDFLLKMVSVTLTNVEKPTIQDDQIVGDFDSYWTEVITAARVPAKRMLTDSSPLIADLNKAVLEFIVPARDVIRAVDELAHVESLRDTEGFIRRSFTNYCAQAILVDSVVDQRELQLFHDLAPTLMFFGHQGSIQNLQELFRTAVKNIGPNETPLLVGILDIYDNSMKTELGRRARSLYFKLANLAFKADLSVTQEEVDWLAQFKKTLYPEGTVDIEQISKQTSGSKSQPVIATVSAAQSLEDLNQLIGLDRVRQEFAQLVNFIKVQQMRVEKGLPGSSVPKHFVFYGNPGTGKTSVSRILGNVYREMGIIKKGRVAEVNCSDLLTSNVSQSSLKIREAVSSNRGNVLFIDEAYAFGQGSQGAQYVDALIKAMDDHRDAVVVVLAGNQQRLESFVNAHSGLKSRFGRSFQFDDFTPEQMVQIYEMFCTRAAFQSSPSALSLVQALFEQLYSKRGESFGNAGEVRHIFESIIGHQANRIISLPHVNEEILSTIIDDDVRPFVSLEKPDDKQTVHLHGHM